ncbi:glycosyltransferase, partial [bacterium]|nr:glycosyltransferase [bacterium]
SWGGNEKWATEAARGLLCRGHRVVAFWTHATIRAELESRGIPARRVRLWGDVNPFGFSALVRLLRGIRPDVLILTKQREYWMGGLASRIAGRPLVVLRHGLRRPLREDFKRRLAFGRFADLVIVNSGDVRDTLLGAEWLDPSKIRVLLNGVETSKVADGAGLDFLESLGIAPGTPVVAGVGRLTNQKGFDGLIRAMALVREEMPGTRLVLVGEGSQRRSLEELARSEGLTDTVVFAGYRTDVREILSAVDVYALSSTNEGMANTLLEAMSVGAPIVATDVSGSREAVRDGVDGLVVPPSDPTALADGILTLLRDRELSARLGASARQRAVERFGRDRMASELEQLLRSGLNAREESEPA